MQFQQVTARLSTVKLRSGCLGGPLIGMEDNRLHKRTSTPKY